MYWRAIVRVSFNADKGSVVRNSIVPILEKAGFQNTKTGTWEVETADEAILLRAIGRVTRQVGSPSGVQGANANAVLDHLWIYIDRRKGSPRQADEDDWVNG